MILAHVPDTDKAFVTFAGCLRQDVGHQLDAEVDSASHQAADHHSHCTTGYGVNQSTGVPCGIAGTDVNDFQDSPWL